MANKDYKNSQHPDVKKSRRPVAVWVVFATGLATGLFAAAILYLHQQKLVRQAGVDSAQTRGAPVIDLPAPPAQSREQEPASGGRGLDAAKTKGKKDVTQVDVIKQDENLVSRYQFYTILPRQEVIIPEQEIQSIERRQKKHAGDKGADEPDIVYVLQAGSFRRMGDADRLRARLALLGVESSVQAVQMDNDGTWYRVRIGPNSSYREIDKLRRRMNDNNISSILFKVKPEDT